MSEVGLHADRGLAMAEKVRLLDERQMIEYTGRHWQARFWRTGNEDEYGPRRATEEEAVADMGMLASGEMADHGHNDCITRAREARDRGMFLVWAWMSRTIGDTAIDIRKYLELPFAPFPGLTLEGVTWSKDDVRIRSVWFDVRAQFFWLSTDDSNHQYGDRLTRAEVLEWVGELIEEGCEVDECETLEFWAEQHPDGGSPADADAPGHWSKAAEYPQIRKG